MSFHHAFAWVGWSAAVVFAWLVLDARVSPAVMEWGTLDGDSWTAWLLRRPGRLSTCLIVGAIVTWLHPWRWRAGALVVSAGCVGGILIAVLKVLFGRLRPSLSDDPFAFDPFFHGFTTIIQDHPQLSTPSGDTVMAFAIAGSLAVLWPRYRWVWLAIALATGLQRIWENVHYPSDVTLGAFIGLACAWWFGRRLHPRKSESHSPAVEFPPSARPNGGHEH